MSALIGRIRSWAGKELRYWEQAALELIAKGGEIGGTDIQKIAEHFLEDAGLAPIPDNRPRLTFPDRVTNTAASQPHKLERIFNLRNVNALPEGQELRFGSQLTFVYGENGAGKTGYARPLASAGFSRGDRDVLPDASHPERQSPPEASIEISSSGSKKTIIWRNGERNPELAGVYVFDAESVVIHLTRSNALTFSPSALLLLTRLAELTDRVRERIKTIIGERDRTSDFHVLLDGDSRARQFVLSLGPMTSQESLRNLATLSEEEHGQLLNLEKQIAELKVLDVPRQIARRRQEAVDLENLISLVTKAQSVLGDPADAQVRSLIEAVSRNRVDAERHGAAQFAFPPFTHVGSAGWTAFLEAAKSLADTEVERGNQYPETGKPCLLCRQPLSGEAADLLRRFWEYLQSDTQAKLDSAEQECKSRKTELLRLNLEYFASDSNSRRLLEEEAPLAIPAIEAQTEACMARRQSMVESLTSYEYLPPPPLIQVDLTEVEKLAQLRRKEVETLTNSDAGQQLQGAETVYRELKHRQILATKLQDIIAFIEDKKWAAKARENLGSTRLITTKYNELFKELVTDTYIKLFRNTLARFRKDMRVSVETRGAKGETVRQLALSTNRPVQAFSISQVLSDGEKRAVAISDFLAEAMLDNNCCTIIFDDPVTSLDSKWKDTISECVVELAKLKQVVIFTHDLAFLYRAKAHAEEKQVQVVTHWIKSEAGFPGFVYQDNSPVCEKDYKSAKLARDLYEKGRKLQPQEQQAVLQQGFGALRTSYEALVIFDLFNGVVERFEEVISFGRLNEVRIDQQLSDEIIKRMETISRFIDAHLHSDRFAAVKPTADDLIEEINRFEEIRKRQKELKKKTA